MKMKVLIRAYRIKEMQGIISTNVVLQRKQKLYIYWHNSNCIQQESTTQETNEKKTRSNQLILKFESNKHLNGQKMVDF
jgi:hypothetical protein